MDCEYPDDFRRKRICGYAEKHAMRLKLGASALTNLTFLPKKTIGDPDKSKTAEGS
jgi:hypothetical protein